MWLLVACALVTDSDLADRFDLDGDGVSRPDDCDDADANIGSAGSLYVDVDGDGYGGGDPVGDCSGEGLVSEGGDCDEGNPAINPENEWYPDADGDGFGDPAGLTHACDPGAGWVENADDCNDACDACHTGAIEACGDAFDNDCDGVTARECALSGEIGTDEAAATITFGASDYVSLADVGDVDGDGREDLFGGAPYDGWAIVNAGEGRRAVGDASDIHVDRVYGVGFGTGDGDSDGLGDVLVGDRVTANGGPIYVLPLAGESNFTPADGVKLVEIELFNSVEYGWVGDLNGDGADDLSVAYSSDGVYQPGVDVYLGPFTAAVHGPSVHLDATPADPSSAKLVAAGGDINGDGIGDLLLSQTWIDDMAGEAYVRFGPAQDGAIADADITFSEESSYFFGLRLASGDANGDGYADVVVGTQSRANADGTLIYLGPSGESVAALRLRDGYGASVSAVGDLSGDGRDDVAVSEQSGFSDGAAVHVALAPFSGSMDIQDVEVAKIVPDYTPTCAGFGYNLVFADTNADGNDDLWIADVCGVPDKAAYLFLGGAD